MSRRTSRSRRGTVAIEAVITLSALMLVFVSAYLMARVSSANLYHVISVMLGSPYL